jgi:cytochrome c
MDGFEWNKVFAAVLVAGIVASSAGFISDHVVSAKEAVAHGSTEVNTAGAAAPQMPEPVLAMIAGADPEQGKKLTKACAACHSFEKGGPDGVGPDLWNIMNRGRAKEPGFAYSAGMTAKGGKWTYSDLNHFLWKPKKFISDTKMNFVGLKKPEDRAAVIAYLRTLADAPPAMPSSGEIAAEQAELGGAATAAASPVPAPDGDASAHPAAH